MAKEDLIPVTERSKEEAKALSRKGGINSGKARRAKKTMKDTLQMMLELTLKDGALTSAEDIKSLADLKDANLTVEQAVLFAQLKKAMKGDTSSAVFIRDTSGNKLAEEMSIKQDIDSTITEIQKYVDSK